jgi:hypothetical protein
LKINTFIIILFIFSEEILSNKTKPYLFEKEFHEKATQKNPEKELKIYSNTEQISKEMILEKLKLDPELRYKKYLEMVKQDNRMWSLKQHGMYLLCNNLTALIFISFIFKRKYKPELIRFYYINNKMKILKSFKPLFYLAVGVNLIALFYLYYYSRVYLYDDAYENYYGPKAISTKDFLDLYDSIMLKKKLKEFNL